MNKKSIVLLILITVLLFAFAINVSALPQCPYCYHGCEKTVICLGNGQDQIVIRCTNCSYIWSIQYVTCTHIFPRD